MTYKHLIAKIEKLQDKIHDNIARDKGVGDIPDDLVEKSMAVDAWLEDAPKKLGENEVATMTPDIDPLLDYSNALGLYHGIFDKKVQSEIVELQELIKELFNDVMDPIQDPGL